MTSTTKIELLQTLNLSARKFNRLVKEKGLPNQTTYTQKVATKIRVLLQPETAQYIKMITGGVSMLRYYSPGAVSILRRKTLDRSRLDL